MNGTGWPWLLYLGSVVTLMAAAGWYGTRYEARRNARYAAADQDAKFCAAHDIDWHGTPETTR